MDHISNFLNFSLAGNDPGSEHKPEPIPSFSDLPIDSLSSENGSGSATPIIPPNQIGAAEVKKRLYALKDEITSIIHLLELHPDLSFPVTGQSPVLPTTRTSALPYVEKTSGGEQILEGTFNGEKMKGPDGQEYAVPPNYASKSKLVEGDRMKLTITPYGKFIFKQIGPIERKRIIGVLQFDEATQLWSVLHEGKTYKILTASATFYHGKPGDHAVILVPKDIPCGWGAVENIIAS
jgi:hypothetical protein